VLGIFAVPNIVPRFVIPGNVAGLFTLGMALVWAGILFRFWAVRKLGKFFRSKVVIQDRHTLISHGPYKYLRNPSYTGVLLTLVGFGIGIGNWLSMIVLFTTGLLSFVRRIAVEDRALTERFGKEYEEYRKKTWGTGSIPLVASSNYL
jgi:protein-S-isoprenylcysteine O-methyltransferase